MLVNLFNEFFQIAVSTEPDDAKAAWQLRDNIERIDADGAGRSQNHQVFATHTALSPTGRGPRAGATGPASCR